LVSCGRSFVDCNASAMPELEDKVVIVNGVAKTYTITGWRVG
jgi:aspartate aminotransferase